MDAKLTVSTLLLLLKPRTKHFDNINIKNTKITKESSENSLQYFNPHPDVVAAGPCRFRYKTNTIQNRIPGKEKVILCKVTLKLFRNYY